MLAVFCGIIERGNNWLEKWAQAINGIVIIIAVPILPLTVLLYIFARISTLVIAFTTLRALPLDAFRTVDWATFIPHL